MAVAATPTYYTLKTQVPLPAGHTLAFEAGKGYYAKPAAAVPAATPQPGLAQQAAKQAMIAVKAQQAPIADQQAAYDAQMEQRRQAYVQLAQAASAALAAEGPAIQHGYQGAATDLSSIAAPLSEGVRSDLQQTQDANRSFVNATVAGADPSTAPNAQAVKDALYATGALYPGQELESKGLAGLTWGEQQPSIAIAQGTADLKGLDAQIATQDAAYRKQLSDVVSQYPQLRDAALQSLRQWDLDKANYRLQAAQQAETRTQNDRNYQLQLRATQDQESQLGLDRRKVIDSENQWSDTIKLQRGKQRADLQAAIAKGAQPNAALSKVYRYVVDSHGNAILDSSGARIPVQSVTPANGKDSALQKATSAAVAIIKANARQVTVPTPDNPATPQNESKTPKTRYAASYYETLGQVEAVIEPILTPQGYSTSEIIKTAQRLTNQWYAPGKGGRPRATRTRGKSK